MVNLKLVKDNTGKDIPEQPIITYELVADLGEDGTRTVYETSSLTEIPNIVTGLCPRSWDNTDVSPLSRVQINGILDNCEKCQRYSQCNKVAELNDRLAELDESEGK